MEKVSWEHSSETLFVFIGILIPKTNLNFSCCFKNMSNLNNLNFTPLDTMGIGYHKWVRDVRNHLKTQLKGSYLRSVSHLPPPHLLKEQLMPPLPLML
jgi:hypothetical protein